VERKININSVFFCASHLIIQILTLRLFWPESTHVFPVVHVAVVINVSKVWRRGQGEAGIPIRKGRGCDEHPRPFYKESSLSSGVGEKELMLHVTETSLDF